MILESKGQENPRVQENPETERNIEAAGDRSPTELASQENPRRRGYTEGRRQAHRITKPSRESLNEALGPSRSLRSGSMKLPLTTNDHDPGLAPTAIPERRGVERIMRTTRAKKEKR